MIINLHTMTDSELIDCRNEVWEVYSDCVDTASALDYGTIKRMEYSDIAREAWADLRELSEEWGRRGHDNHLFLMGAGFGPVESKTDRAASAARR